MSFHAVSRYCLHSKKLPLLFLIFTHLCVFSVAQTNEKRFGIFSEGLRTFEENGKMGFVDDTYKIIHQATLFLPEYSELPFFKEGLCMFFKNKNEYKLDSYQDIVYGFMNTRFEKILSAVYKYPEFLCDGFPNAFSQGVTIVPYGKAEFQYILINKKGMQIGKPFSYSLGCTAACNFYP